MDERLIQAELNALINDMTPVEYADDNSEDLDLLFSLYCVGL
jgi:hypothetical protein